MSLHSQIRELAKEKKAIILAHSYTYPEVQEVADFVGDSYGLSKKAATLQDYEIILFAGVRFMAETAAILAPDKKVILPVENAGCPMADMITEYDLAEMKKDNPSAAVVCYVNSTAEVKALSDVCVTSSNAVNIVRKLPEKQIIFVPDRHLGSFVAEQIPEKEFVFCQGHCPVHVRVLPEDVLKVKTKHHDAVILMHPECRAETRRYADFVLSTGQMIELVKEKRFKKYIIVTEQGISHALTKSDPEAEFFDLTDLAMTCPNMKKNTLETILKALQEEETLIEVAEPVASNARKSLEKMLELAE